MRRITSAKNTIGGLAFEETDMPPVEPNECLIKVSAFSMNRGEVRFAQDNEPGTPIGWDVAGVIEKTADDRSGPPVGTRIAAFCARMDGWAEHVAIPSDFLAPIPERVTDAVAATLPVAGLTALHCVEKGSRLLGNRVLSTGATGGVGLFAMQLAKLAGAQSIAQVRKPVQEAFVREYGADDVIVTSYGEEAGRLAPYRLIVDGIGGEMLGNLIKFTGKGGTIVNYGVTGGEQAKIALYPDLFGNDGQKTLYGLSLYTEIEFESAGSGLTRLLSLVEKGRLKTHIGIEESWENSGEVAAALLERKFSGKAVLHLK